ncbi:MAG: flavodoxin domain-containing protein [Actinomycetota bacterium]|nr:flavodoxin domain-containing protein [Actinomycetota bacterium]
MNVLVTYGSSRGGTAGLADMVGDELRERGLRVEVLPAAQIHTLAPYDGVVVGAAIYINRCHPDVRRFVRHHRAELRQMPTFFFSSGPLDDSATTDDIPPVGQVEKLMDMVGAVEHVTFGGRLEPDAEGFVAGAMARKMAGDFRDRAQVTAWADRVADEMAAAAV